MRVEDNFDLTQYNSYRIRSKCARAWFPNNPEDIIELFEQKENYILIGNGFNIILAKEHYEQEFIIFNGNFNQASISPNGVLSAEAGCSMLSLSNLALEHSFAGLEIFYDIPSSIGGAVVMNAGASGEEIKDILVKVEYLDLRDHKVKQMNQADMLFEYRNSFFQRNTGKIILKVWLQLTNGCREEIKTKMETIKKQRWSKQPKNEPNAGSVFKRPKGYYVGAIIDELGLKGLTVGGAKISEKHGGFIVNYDNAKGKDIVELISKIQHMVKKNKGVDLEVEQRII